MTKERGLKDSLNVRAIADFGGSKVMNSVECKVESIVSPKEADPDDPETPMQLGNNLAMRGLIIGTEAHMIPALISTLLHMKDIAPFPKSRHQIKP